MKTKTSLFALLLLAVATMFLSCGQHDFAEDDIKWSDDNGGTLEVFNGTNKDMVLFIGQVPKSEDILGGVRAGKPKKIDIGSHVPDFSVGGYAIIRGVTRDEYNAKRFDLANAKWEFNSMTTYKAGVMYRINIDPKLTGEYGVRITNRAKVGLELRKDSPQGEKVAYLPALSVNNWLYAQDATALHLFPVYVFYNKSTQEVSTLYASSMEDMQGIAPRPITSSQVPSVIFPFNEEDAWNKIVKQLKDPSAYIKVTNNAGVLVYFTNAGSQWFLSQEGYDAINPGETLVFEVKAGDWDEDINEGGQKLNLIADYSAHTKQIPIRFAGKETELPLIKNGYNYDVSIEPDQINRGNYIGIITEKKKRDISNMIESL